MNERRVISQAESVYTDNRDVTTTIVGLKDGTEVEVDLRFALDLVENAVENAGWEDGGEMLMEVLNAITKVREAIS